VNFCHHLQSQPLPFLSLCQPSLISKLCVYCRSYVSSNSFLGSRLSNLNCYFRHQHCTSLVEVKILAFSTLRLIFLQLGLLPTASSSSIFSGSRRLSSLSTLPAARESYVGQSFSSAPPIQVNTLFPAVYNQFHWTSLHPVSSFVRFVSAKVSSLI
jgi:hypothetical protein